MNRTNWEHAGFALLMQAPFGLAGHLLAWLFGLPWLAVAGWWIGTLPGVFFFLGREGAQYEKKLVHGGSVAALPWWIGFGFLVRGSLDSKLDFWVQAVAVVFAATLAAILL